MVLIFPNLCLWRRSLRSNLGGIDPEKLYRATLNQEKCIKYLGVFIDSSLSWKCQIQYILIKIKRSVGILSKIRYYVDINVLSNLYYALTYPFLIYEIIARGNTYSTTLQPLFILQKKSYLPYDIYKFS